MGMLATRCNALFRNLIGALFAGNPGKEYFMLGPFFINHSHLDQVFVQGGIQTMQTDRTKEINALPVLKLEAGMFYTGVISHFWMKQKQSFLPFGIPDPEDDILSNP
jgi:hypothetical protein